MMYDEEKMGKGGGWIIIDFFHAEENCGILAGSRKR